MAFDFGLVYNIKKFRMEVAMISLKQYVKIDNRKKKQYFRTASLEIAQQNLRLLQLSSLSTVAFLLLFFLLTPLIIPEWEMTPQHFWFLPASLSLFLISFLYQKLNRGSFRFVTFLCILFEVVVAFFIILIDVYTSREAPGSFFAPLCLALPAMFILPLHLSYLLIFCFEALYIALTLSYKTSFIAQYDIFTSIVGISFSFVIAHTILHLRAGDFDLRLKYQQLSRRDALSDILNKKAFEDSAKAYLQRDISGCPRPCTLLIFDIDNFKVVNDNLGHYAGDQLLSLIGNRLPELFRSTDIVGRFGGDEFVILLIGPLTRDTLEEKCRSIHRQISEIKLPGLDTHITCSIGCGISDGSVESYDELFRLADRALYTAKETGKNRHCMLDTDSAQRYKVRISSPRGSS